MMAPQYNGNSPYYGAHSPAPVKEPFFRRLLRSSEYAPFRELFVTSLIIGLGFLAYPALADIYVYVISNVPGMLRAYTEDLTFGYLCDIVYSFMCVGFPFLLVYIMLSASGRYPGELPAGKVRSPRAAFILIFAGLGVCFAGDLVSGYLTSFFQSFGMEFYSYQQALEGEEIPAGAVGGLVYLLRTALVPALIEEFALRGVVLQSLRKYGDWFAIVVSAVMFGLMHGNMTQMPFALIAGVALGYCFVVTGSIWPNVIIHFMNNFVAVVYTVLVNRLGDGAGMIFNLAAVYGFIGVGIVAVVVYCVKNPRFARLYPSEYYGQKKKARAFFLAPTTLIAVVILLGYVYRDIVR